MSNDIRDILQRLTAVESKLTPTSVKHGLNKQQKSVPQLPALFKPHGIRALGAKTDPAHPMDGYMVGDSVEPRRTALEEAMAEIEEDMLSKVKKDLTQYLDRLEKRVRVDRDLKDKARDAVQKRQPEEEIEEVNAGDDAAYGKYADTRAKGDMLNKEINGDNDSISMKTYTSPQLKNVVSDLTTGLSSKYPEMEKRYTMNKLNTPAPTIPDGDLEESPVATFEMADGIALECWGDDHRGYEIRHGEKTLPSRFKNLDDAGIAVKLYQARRQKQQRPEQDLSQDYIEER